MSLWGPIIGAATSWLLGEALGGSSSSSRGINATNQIASTQAGAIQDQRNRLNELANIIRGLERAPTFSLPKAAGGPANDPAFYESIQHMTPINLMLALIGQGNLGIGGATTAAALEQGQQNQASEFISEIGSAVGDAASEALRKDDETAQEAATESAGGEASSGGNLEQSSGNAGQLLTSDEVVLFLQQLIGNQPAGSTF